MTTSSNPTIANLSFSICFILSSVILSVDCVFPLGVAGGVPYVAVVLLTLQMPKIRYTIYAGALCSLYTFVGIFGSPLGGELWQVIVNRGLALFAIWVTAGLGIRWKILLSRHQVALQEREKALEDVNILRGLLPICASCKKIRNEAGLWDQLEVYIRDHSEANFTHSICPKCEQTLYGLEMIEPRGSGTCDSPMDLANAAVTRA